MLLCYYIIHLTDAFKVGHWRNFHKECLPDDLKKHHDNLQTLVKLSKSDNTYKQYNCYFKSFCQWCKKYEFKPLPASDYHVALFLSSMKDSSPSASKVNAITYSISWAHKVSGFSDPCNTNLVSFTKNGLLRDSGRPIQQKSEISKEDLLKLIAHFGNTTNILDLRFICMCLVSFAGFLRFSELSHIKRSDLKIFSDCAEIFISSSKTDQCKAGEKVIISRTGKCSCPVSFLEKFLFEAEINDKSCDYIFCNIRYSRKLNKHILCPGKPISYNRAREILITNLKAVGIDSKQYGLHSFRSGGATAAVANGVSERLLKKHGRWKSDSAKDRYVRDSVQVKMSVSKNLGI